MTRSLIWDLLFRPRGPDGELARRSRSQRAHFISFVVALNLYPPGTPLRAERIAGEMPAGLSAPAVRYLLNKLPIVDRLAFQLRDDPSRKTVRLMPDVEHCVACGLAEEAVPLVDGQAG